MMLYTIFTPTYNRAHTLQRCYDSIVAQEHPSLEWLIIDDGSTDKTAELVKKWQFEKKINIRYIYQNNTGKQAAWNRAISEAKGDYFIGLDSDDAFINHSLDKISQYLTEINKKQEIIGLRCLAINQQKGTSDSNFLLKRNSTASWFDEFSSRKTGERIDVLKSAIIRKFPYPVKDGIKFIPEIWFYTTISSHGYKFFYTNKAVSIFFDNHNKNRLSRSKLREHARGHLIARSAMLRSIPASCFIKNPIALLKTIIRYAQCKFYISRDDLS